MKRCHFCDEKIQEKATKCKHCNEWLITDQPFTKKLKFGAKLRILRQKRKMTLKIISHLSGVQISILSRMENNKSTGSLKNYMGIAHALGLRLSELFAAIENK